jgi:hypothetical protein
LDQAESATGDETVLIWKSYAEGHGVTSIPRCVEFHSERLRTEYFGYARDLGERQVAGKRFVDHFDMGTGFTLWWMTRIPEKSSFKAPRIYDCLRLMALKETLLERKPSVVPGPPPIEELCWLDAELPRWRRALSVPRGVDG